MCKMETSVQPRLLDLKGAAGYLGLTYWSVRDIVLNGEVPFIKRDRRKYYVDRRDLDAWVDKSKERIGN